MVCLRVAACTQREPDLRNNLRFKPHRAQIEGQPYVVLPTARD